MKQLTFVIALAAVLVVLAACAAPAPTATPVPPPPPAGTPVVIKPGETPAPTKPPEPTKPPPPTPTKGPVKGGTYMDSMFSDAVSLQPLLTNDSASTNLQGLIYTGPLRRDPFTLKLAGNLYDGEPQLSGDGSTVTWKLKKGIKWSDGTPITSADFVFTWEKMMDEKVKFLLRTLYKDAITSVTAPDPETVVFKMAKPGFCPAIDYTSFSIVPKHVFEKLDINQNDVNDKPTATNGLFKFKEWVKDDHFTANPSYKDFVRGEPNLDGYTYRILKDNTVRTQMFKTQDVDFAQPDPIDVEDLKKLPFANFVHYYSPTGGYTYIGIYPGNTPFLADKKVRQAITTAINRQEMVDKIVLGYGTPLHSFLHGANWAYSDNVPKFSYDAAKAKQMLKEAGFTPGSGGILQKDGKPFKINLYYNAGNKVREQIAIISQQYLKDVGIQAEVIAEEWNAYLERVRNTKKDLDLFVLGWTGGFDPHGTSNIWKTKMSQNYVLYSNAEVDKLFDEAASVPGCKQEDRAKVYAKIQQLIAEDQPYIFLYTPEAIEFYNKRVQLNPMSKLGVNYFIEKWEIVSAK